MPASRWPQRVPLSSNALMSMPLICHFDIFSLCGEVSSLHSSALKMLGPPCKPGVRPGPRAMQIKTARLESLRHPIFHNRMMNSLKANTYFFTWNLRIIEF